MKPVLGITMGDPSGNGDVYKRQEYCCLKSVTVSREPSGKYYASLLCEAPDCENQTAGKTYGDARILGIDYAMHGMAVFSEKNWEINVGYYRKSEKKLAWEQRKLSRCVKGSRNYLRQRHRVALCHEKIRNQRKDFLHKLSRGIADRYDVAAVEDINMKAMSRCMHFGKSVLDVYKRQQNTCQICQLNIFGRLCSVEHCP